MGWRKCPPRLPGLGLNSNPRKASKLFFHMLKTYAADKPMAWPQNLPRGS